MRPSYFIGKRDGFLEAFAAFAASIIGMVPVTLNTNDDREGIFRYWKHIYSHLLAFGQLGFIKAFILLSVSHSTCLPTPSSCTHPLTFIFMYPSVVICSRAYEISFQFSLTPSIFNWIIVLLTFGMVSTPQLLSFHYRFNHNRFFYIFNFVFLRLRRGVG